jgi:quinol monooxygenase YgiN
MRVEKEKWMAVTRINEFQAREGQGDALCDRLRSFVPLIEASAGCRSCQLLQGRDDPTRIVVIEVWDSAEAHQASLRGVPAEAIAETMQLLAGPPKGAYYRS